jgi:hypothetical protein
MSQLLKFMGYTLGRIIKKPCHQLNTYPYEIIEELKQ